MIVAAEPNRVSRRFVEIITTYSHAGTFYCLSLTYVAKCVNTDTSKYEMSPKTEWVLISLLTHRDNEKDRTYCGYDVKAPVLSENQETRSE